MTSDLEHSAAETRSMSRQDKPVDNRDEDWWFCSTAIPLIAATLGPFANVLSIAALVTYWRQDLNVGPDDALVPELQGRPFADPNWCYNLNAVSLTCGVFGNLFLLANFTNRIRYIVALPVTIVAWFLATGMLIAITVAMQVYTPPIGPLQSYTQGFWYAVFAAVFYLLASVMLMFNMLGCFLGHYGQHFNLTESQRTLILQTMMFFIWLAGGAGVFAAVEGRDVQSGWGFVNALYFCDVTILTVGFGDVVLDNTVGQGLVFPYAVGGIIMLGLVISSISRFAGELSHTNIIRRQVEVRRVRTLERSISEDEARLDRMARSRKSVDPFLSDYANATDEEKNKKPMLHALKRSTTILLHSPHQTRRRNKSRLLVLREEKDRFDAMRKIQRDVQTLKQWTALIVAIFMFGILWCVGAALFWVAEANTLQLTYFQALYFCYVSLLTIGYGDVAPKSNVGRAFFVVWSLLAVPSMTLLISLLGSTAIKHFKKTTEKLADFTVLPKEGVWRDLAISIRLVRERGTLDRRRSSEIVDGVVDDTERNVPTLEELAQPEDDVRLLAQKLAVAIRRTAKDVRRRRKHYAYEEWIELAQLIRFTHRQTNIANDDDPSDDALMMWDWLGEQSPMAADQSESEFVLERLCESMERYIRRLQGDAGPQSLR